MEVRVESLGPIFKNSVNYRHGGVSVKKLNDTEYEIEMGYRVHTVSFRAPEDLYNKLVEIARRENTTVSYIIRRALNEYLSKQYEW